MRTFAICAAGITLIALGIWYAPPEADDFGPFYRAAALVSAHNNVYAGATWSPAKQADGRFLPYLRLPAYAEALRPLTAFPYRFARRLWIAALIFAVLAALWLFPTEQSAFAVALAFSFPLANTLMIGQDICFVLLIVLASARIFSSGREFAAGFVASLLCIKVTYLPAAGLVFLAKSHRGLWGFLTGTVVQFAACFAVGGPGWVSDYMVMLRSPLLDPEPGRMPGIRGVVAALALPYWVYAVAALALYFGFWLALRRLSLADGLSLALALGLIAAPHAKVYDGVVLIPMFVRLASLGSRERALAFIGLAPVLYLMVLMGAHPVMLAGSSLIVALSVMATMRLAAKRETGEPAAVAACA